MTYALRPQQVDFVQKWDSLEGSISRIINLQSIDRRVWDDAFSDIYQLCVAIPEPLCHTLYEKTKLCLEEHVKQLYQNVRSSQGVDLLSAYFNSWQTYHQGATFIHNLFGYLNKQFVRSRRHPEGDLQYGSLSLSSERDNQQTMEIGELALSIWRRLMIEPMESDLVRQLLLSLAADRSGDECLAPTDIVRGVIFSFVQVEEYCYPTSSTYTEALSLYRKIFESCFLKATSEHYQQEASQLLAECTISSYMEKVIQRIEEEKSRSEKFLHPSSYDKVIKMCQDVMVSDHKDRLDAVCREIVFNENRADLRNMYVLLKPIRHGVAELVREFEGYVRRTGLERVQSMRGENVPQQFVDGVIDVHSKFSAIAREVFNDDGEFVGALDKALQSSVNHKEESRSCPKASEWLARYTDTLLRKSAKGLSEIEVESKLAMAIVIFRYIEDKDIFQKFYSRMLAQRLIHDASVSMDAEEQMITKLKQACGYEFTSKLTRMFTDVGLSRDLTDKFNDDCKTKAVTLNVDVRVLVLQAGAWPLSANQPMALEVPVELQQSISLFESFYTTSHNGRKLTWLFNLATAEVKLNYLDKQYQVTMSVQQLAALLCFARRDSQTVAELESATQLVGDTLVRVLRGLVDAGILTIDDQEDKESLNPQSVISLNFAMSSKRVRFKITAPSIQKQVEKETSESVNTTVHQDRKYYMECTIVRIMKTRKLMKHNGLVNEIIDQTKSRFTPDINFIKKSIESLIEKAYIQRTDQNDEYQYLA